MVKASPTVLAIASGGGHWVQLMRLTPAWDGCDVVYVTTDPGFEVEVQADAAARAQKPPRFYAVVGANRWQWFRLLVNCAQVFWIILRTRPDVIVTTGAAPGFFAVRIGRLFRVRTMWIDSIANAKEVSLSGQKAMTHASSCLTQWPHLAADGGPEYRGAVL